VCGLLTAEYYLEELLGFSDVPNVNPLQTDNLAIQTLVLFSHSCLCGSCQDAMLDHDDPPSFGSQQHRFGFLSCTAHHHKSSSPRENCPLRLSKNRTGTSPLIQLLSISLRIQQSPVSKQPRLLTRNTI
jgi:hypothetical protein